MQTDTSGTQGGPVHMYPLVFWPILTGPALGLNDHSGGGGPSN